MSIIIISLHLSLPSVFSLFLSTTVVLPQICIEMADSSGVTQVVEKYNTFSPDSFNRRTAWYACMCP